MFDAQKNSRYDGQVAVFGSEFQQKLADASYFLVSLSACPFSQLVTYCLSSTGFYAPQLYRQVLLRRVLAMGILSVRLSVCHNPVVYQAQVR